MKDGNRVQDKCNMLNWGALDHASHAPQLSQLQLPLASAHLIWRTANIGSVNYKQAYYGKW